MFILYGYYNIDDLTYYYYHSQLKNGEEFTEENKQVSVAGGSDR